jgi:hypothetical protein
LLHTAGWRSAAPLSETNLLSVLYWKDRSVAGARLL